MQVNCLIAFTNNPHSLDVALNAIAFLRFCAMKLAEGDIGKRKTRVKVLQQHLFRKGSALPRHLRSEACNHLSLARSPKHLRSLACVVLPAMHGSASTASCFVCHHARGHRNAARGHRGASEHAHAAYPRGGFRDADSRGGAARNARHRVHSSPTGNTLLLFPCISFTVKCQWSPNAHRSTSEQSVHRF